MININIHIVLSWILVAVGLAQEIPLKICSTTAEDSACQQVARTYEAACNYNFNNVDCLLNVQNNKSHLGRITGDDALHAANLLSEDVVVLAEIRRGRPTSQTVVIMKNTIPDGFVNLQGKKICHPGYSYDLQFPHLLLQEFENKIINLSNPSCNDNITLIERNIKALSEFFGESCRPGEWTQNERTDKRFKTKYSSLCRLCDGQTCDVKYETPFNDSLRCLLDNDADVAITTLREAQLFFNSSSNSQKYKYLCKNGSSTSAAAPCTWSGKLYDLLVSERSVAHKVEQLLRDNLDKQTINSTKINEEMGKLGEALTAVLKMQYNEKITFLEEYSSFKSLKQYVRERVVVPTPTESVQCGRTLKWCTYTDKQQEKCTWLSQAGIIWGIPPVVECVRSEGDTELNCLDDIKKDRADIVVASSDYAYISLNKGLRSVAFPETDTRNLSVILAVKRTYDNTIKSFEDLKNKQACIPRYGGKEHLAFVDTLRKQRVASEEMCDYGQVLSDFIGNSCVPGVKASLIKESTEFVDHEKLCEQCRPNQLTPTDKYCNDDTINKYFDSRGAIDCLREKAGDFAVITRNFNDTALDLKVICKNNTLASVGGLNVDNDCALHVLPNSEVVASNSSSKIPDIRLALYEFERWFGKNLRKTFHLFDRFDGEKDLLFLDSTPGLNIEGSVENIEDYKQLLRNVKKCNVNGSVKITNSLILLLMSSVFYLTQRIFF